MDNVGITLINKMSKSSPQRVGMFTIPSHGWFCLLVLYPHYMGIFFGYMDNSG